MGQKTALISITPEMKQQQEARAHEPGACAAMERSLFSSRAAIPTSGNGPGFTRACDRADCEWQEGTVCARWLRKARVAAGVCSTCGGAWVEAEQHGMVSLDARLCPRLHFHGSSYEVRRYTCENGHVEGIRRSGWKNIDGCEHRVEPVPWPPVRAENVEVVPS